MMQLEPDRLEFTPKSMGRTIQQFCAKRLNAANPRYLPVRPTRYSASKFCHQTVVAQIEREGGAARFGWLIRERPGMYLTVDTYAVLEVSTVVSLTSLRMRSESRGFSSPMAGLVRRTASPSGQALTSCVPSDPRPMATTR